MFDLLYRIVSFLLNVNCFCYGKSQWAVIWLRKRKGECIMFFAGKTAVASGAASGMGLLFCQNFADLGGNVVMADVNAEAVAACAADITAKGKGKALAVKCDVRDYEQICHVRDEAVRVFGSIDILVNFAGGTAVRMLNVDENLDFPEIPIEVYDWGLDVNLKGQFFFFLITQ